MNYDAWLAQQTEEYNRSCEPYEDKYGNFNCYECDNDDCEYWDTYHDGEKGE